VQQSAPKWYRYEGDDRHSQMFAVANPTDRYAIGDRDELAFNEDGSLSLCIQHESPGKDEESNWLPSPRSGGIIPIMGLYGPQQDAIAGRWDPPNWQRIWRGRRKKTQPRKEPTPWQRMTSRDR
jgi:hypothetical protein